MNPLRLWSPDAERVEVETDGRRIALSRSVGGWWQAPELLAPGTDYAFVVDGRAAVPDPRSGWQPHGIHGPSRIVDPAGFSWSDAGWRPPPLSSAVVYELHVGTFTPEGTFAAASGRLDHLARLGVTHVEIMPVAEFSGDRGWGYDGVDLWAPHRSYGGPYELKRFVDACHRHGLAVLLDVVYNHLGPTGNYLGELGPYFTDRYRTPWGSAVNLDDRGSDEVRRFFVENALFWLRDYHFDGLRLDAVHAIYDSSAVHFLEELATAVRGLEAALGRSLVLIAESDLNDPRIVRPPEVGGYGLDSQWNEDFHHALHALLTGERDGYYADFGTLADLAAVLEHGFLYDGRSSRYRGRRHGRPPTGLAGHRFVGCLQNHDQVGNRAQGERTSHLLSKERLKIGAAIVLTSPFVPMLFQGEEWGASTPFRYFTDHREAELAEAVRHGRQQEFASFGWRPEDVPDPQARETFERSRLDWSEVERSPHRELLEWHRELVRLRRSVPDLSDGRLDRTRVWFDEEASWLRIERGTVAVAANLAGEARSIPLRDGRHRIWLASHDAARCDTGGVSLPAEGVAVLGSES